MPDESFEEISKRLDSELEMLMSHYATIDDAEDYSVISPQLMEETLFASTGKSDITPPPSIVTVEHIGKMADKDRIMSLVDEALKKDEEGVWVPIRGCPSVLEDDDEELVYELAYMCQSSGELLGISSSSLSVPTVAEIRGELQVFCAISLNMAYILPQFRGNGYSSAIICSVADHTSPLEGIVVFCAQHNLELDLTFHAGYESRGGEMIGSMVESQISDYLELFCEKYKVKSHITFDAGY
jgi:GNAT superfamily N-acetyltransferase